MVKKTETVLIKNNKGGKHVSKELVIALSELQEEEALSIVRKLIDTGEDPLMIMNACGQAMDIVGKKYEEGVYFVPDLIFSGEILKSVSAVVKPKLAEGIDQKRLGQVVLGTVAGDIHDIGKDVVHFMLERVRRSTPRAFTLTGIFPVVCTASV
jgi:methanogenic corrinoid protein MtbC1